MNIIYNIRREYIRLDPFEREHNIGQSVHPAGARLVRDQKALAKGVGGVKEG